MIVIESIKAYHVDRDVCNIASYSFNPTHDFIQQGIGPKEAKEAFSVTREMITGRVFRNHRGEELCIGMSKEVQKTIGLPFEFFDFQNRRLDEIIFTADKLCIQFNKDKKRFLKELKPYRQFPVFRKIVRVLHWLLERYGRNY